MNPIRSITKMMRDSEIDIAASTVKRCLFKEGFGRDLQKEARLTSAVRFFMTHANDEMKHISCTGIMTPGQEAILRHAVENGTDFLYAKNSGASITACKAFQAKTTEEFSSLICGRALAINNTNRTLRYILSHGKPAQHDYTHTPAFNMAVKMLSAPGDEPTPEHQELFRNFLYETKQVAVAANDSAVTKRSGITVWDLEHDHQKRIDTLGEEPYPFPAPN